MKSGQHFVCLLWVGNHCQTHFFLCQKSTAQGDWWLCTLIGHNKDQSHPVHPVCPPLSWDTAILETKCMYSTSAVRKYNTFASRSSAWLKTQIIYWETWTWDGKRPWTSAPPASPTPARMIIVNPQLENMTWEIIWILMIGWRGKITTSKSPIPDQDGVLGFSSAVNTYSGIHVLRNRRYLYFLK